MSKFKKVRRSVSDPFNTHYDITPKQRRVRRLQEAMILQRLKRRNTKKVYDHCYEDREWQICPLRNGRIFCHSCGKETSYIEEM